MKKFGIMAALISLIAVSALSGAGSGVDYTMAT
jgi:hypothetical protein